MSDIPRNEYPRPQFERERWQNLNGEWQFAFDFGASDPEGYEDPNVTLPLKITVPFCPESILSGIHHTDFIPCVWYKRTFTVKEEDLSGRVILHFGAVDYSATVWINSKEVCRHEGGYTPFSSDITEYLTAGVNTLTVRAMDDTRSFSQPSGKQCYFRNRSSGCFYTRTTGIWQTVWLEYLPETYIKGVRISADWKTGCVTFDADICGRFTNGSSLLTRISYMGDPVAVTEVPVSSHVTYSVTVSGPKLWDIGKPELYDVEYVLSEDGITDTVRSYFGFRGVELGQDCLYINGRRVFMRTVLDQGYYPDGIYTAPDDDALINDIKLSMDLGFNGARLHQKLFEERYLYHADRLGYIVWGEFPSAGFAYTDPEMTAVFVPQWLEALNRDINHPSIIGWCPLNETWDLNGKGSCREFTETVYKVTKAVDGSRPCIDSSGAVHYETDIFDTHDYCQDIEEIKKNYSGIKTGKNIYDPHSDKQDYNGAPLFISECGGIFWANEEKEGWGYGETPKDESEFTDRFLAITGYFMRNSNICGICYTQLTDVEQEKNGLYTYKRERKFSDGTYRKIYDLISSPAAIEEKQE